MEIDLIEQDSTDFDWFGVDECGYIGHFSTAGFKRLPKTVARNREDLETVSEYFSYRASETTGYLLDSCLQIRVPDWKGEAHEGRYLESFVSMAKKGLFSFDIDTYVTDDLVYFPVAIPERPILVPDLPELIRSIVAKTFLRGVRLDSRRPIRYDATLDM